MYTLYIDTHFINLVMGLFKDGELIEKLELESNRHSENTINMLKKILENNKVLIDEIKEIIVINGPGSFTGVRIGIVIAKIFGVTKNILVKEISYLQALALNYNTDVVVGIKDYNGVFIGEFDKEHNLVGDYFYLSNKDKENYKKEIMLEDNVDLNKVYQYTKNKAGINPHNLKPLYVKKIEVDKWLGKLIYTIYQELMN